MKMLTALPLLPGGPAAPQRVNHLVQGANGPIANALELTTALKRARAEQETGNSPCVGLLAEEDRAFCIVGRGVGSSALVTGLYDARLDSGTLHIRRATPVSSGLAGIGLSWPVVAEIAHTWFFYGEVA